MFFLSGTFSKWEMLFSVVVDVNIEDKFSQFDVNLSGIIVLF